MTRPAPSTPRERLLAACATLCLGAEGTARLLGASIHSVVAWRMGRYAPPAERLEWLERVAGFVKENPPPGK